MLKFKSAPWPAGPVTVEAGSLPLFKLLIKIMKLVCVTVTVKFKFNSESVTV